MLEWDGERFRLASVHEGVSSEEAIAGCGFALDSAGLRARHRAAPAGGTRLLREEIDPHGMRRLETREGRAEALRELEAMS